MSEQASSERYGFRDSWFGRMAFQNIGWLLCQLRGMGDRYAMLIAQSNLETGKQSSGQWLRGGGGWCMHYSATGTPRANGKNDVPGQEPVAQYHGWSLRAFVRMWQDRLDWDRNRIISPGSFDNVEQYADKVLEAGWLGISTSGERRASYKAAWLSHYSRLSWLTRAFGGVGWQAAWWSKPLRILLFLGIFALVAWLLYLLIRYMLRKKGLIK